MALIDVQTQYRELGRIRIGSKNERGLPTKLTTLRFTSAGRYLIDAVAELYGGEPRPWKSPAGDEWEVITTADSIECVVPPQRIQAAQHYELWGKATDKGPVELLRRCDGQTQYDGTGCVCDRDDRECKPRTHLLVMLPQLPGLGVWRLVTGGFNAARELPAAVDLLARLAAEGAPVRAVFSIRQARSTKGGQVHRYVVPQIDIPMTAAELMDSLPPGVGERLLSIGPSHGTAPSRGRPDLPPAPAAGALPQDVESPSFPDVIDVEASDPEARAVDAPPPTTASGSDDLPAPARPDVRGSADGESVRAMLTAHLEALPKKADTMETWDDYCRQLFHLMEEAGLWRKRNDHGHDSLHAALWVNKRQEHLGGLRKSQLIAFTLEARTKAYEKLTEGT